jgi:hypothetical protein
VSSALTCSVFSAWELPPYGNSNRHDNCWEVLGCTWRPALTFVLRYVHFGYLPRSVRFPHNKYGDITSAGVRTLELALTSTADQKSWQAPTPAPRSRKSWEATNTSTAHLGKHAHPHKRIFVEQRIGLSHAWSRFRSDFGQNTRASKEFNKVGGNAESLPPTNN